MLKSSLIYTNTQDYYNIILESAKLATINGYVKTVEKYTKKYQAKFSDLPEDTVVKKCNKYKGDIFEIFSELFFAHFETDPSWGVKDYTPVNITIDYGVDAVGTNANEEKVAIQAKYRSQASAKISYGDVAKTFTDSVQQYGIDPHKNHTNIVITTGCGVEDPPLKVLGSKLIVINRKVISTKVDNNLTFWEGAYNSIHETLNK